MNFRKSTLLFFFALTMSRPIRTDDTLNRIKNFFFWEVTLYDTKTTELGKVRNNTQFRLPFIKFIREESNTGFIRCSHSKLSIFPMEIVSAYLLLRYVPSIYKYFKSSNVKEIRVL